MDDGIIPNKNRIVKEIDKPELWAMGRRISNNLYHNGWKHVSGLEDGIIPNKNQNTMLPEHEHLPLFLDYDTPVHNEGWKHFMDLEDGLIVDQNGHYTYNGLPENYNGKFEIHWKTVCQPTKMVGIPSNIILVKIMRKQYYYATRTLNK